MPRRSNAVPAGVERSGAQCEVAREGVGNGAEEGDGSGALLVEYRAGPYISRMQDDAADARVTARQSWPVRIFRLGEEPRDDLTAETTAEQRLAMVWELSGRMWELAGSPRPSYTRGDMPIRLTRRG